MSLATKIGVGSLMLIIFYLVMNNEKSINNLFSAAVGGTGKEIAALQGR